MITEFWSYFWVILLSVLTAYTELLSRYDDPLLILYKFPSIFYLLLNALSAGLVYTLIDNMGIKISINGSDNSSISQIILAGTSSLLLLRSSFGIFKKGDTDIEIGISGILKIIFTFCDRRFDQIFTQIRLSSIERIMKDKDKVIDFEKAKTDLPVLCMKMMANLTIEESQKFGAEVADIDQPERKNNELLFNKSKIIILGFIISKYTGTKLLEAAVKTLEDDIKILEGEQDETTNLLEQLNSIKSSFKKK
ncbi:MAG: hypothetical protein JXB00_15250 [Bacteroidales bacterium]|nr:hypothetical protein [Bacteroidales bacterium]